MRPEQFIHILKHCLYGHIHHIQLYMHWHTMLQCHTYTTLHALNCLNITTRGLSPLRSSYTPVFALIVLPLTCMGFAVNLCLYFESCELNMHRLYGSFSQYAPPPVIISYAPVFALIILPLRKERQIFPAADDRYDPHRPCQSIHQREELISSQ